MNAHPPHRPGRRTGVAGSEARPPLATPRTADLCPLPGARAIARWKTRPCTAGTKPGQRLALGRHWAGKAICCTTLS